MPDPVKSLYADQLTKLGFIRLNPIGCRSYHEAIYEEVLNYVAELLPGIRDRFSEPPCFFIVKGDKHRTWAIDEIGDAWLCDAKKDLTFLGFSTLLRKRNLQRYLQ